MLGAGLQARMAGRCGVGVRGLSTAYGPLDFHLAARADAPGWRLVLPRALTGGGVRLAWPGAGPLPRALHEADGRELAWQGRELPLPAPPTAVTLLPLSP